MYTALIFASGDRPHTSIIEDLPPADLVVAADGGYESALALGFTVDVVVGDLDSGASGDLPDDLVVERYPRDKEATDLELAMDLVARRSPDRVVVVGGSGGRLDHELATAELLCSDRWDRSIDIDWVSDRGWCHVVRARRTVHGDPGWTVTLLPVGGDAVGVRTQGLKWELVGDTLPHGTTRGVSNVLRGPVAEIYVAQGCLLVILPVPG